MATIKNAFRYSYSRNNVMTSCLRKYYLQYYFHWEGWTYSGDIISYLEGKDKDNFEARRKIAYIYKRSHNLYSYTGNLLHELVEKTLLNIKQGIFIQDVNSFIQDEIYKFKSELEQVLSSQVTLAFLNEPKKHIFFQEFLNSPDYVYGFKKADKVNWDYFMHQAKQLFILNLNNYFQSGLYHGLVNLFNDSKEFCIEEELSHNIEFESSGKKEVVTLTVKPDLFTISKDDILSVYDWKTGSLRNIKMDQLQYYAYLFSEMGKVTERFSSIKGYRLKIYCLKEQAPLFEEFDPNTYNLQNLLGNLKQMSLLTNDGLLDNKISYSRESEFSRKINKGKFGCRGCPLLKICPDTAKELKLV